MNDILIPTLLFWENSNTFYGSKGLARFFLRPVQPEDPQQPGAAPRLEAELWRGPLTKELSEILTTASFPLSEEGLEQVKQWLEDRARELNP